MGEISLLDLDTSDLQDLQTNVELEAQHRQLAAEARAWVAGLTARLAKELRTVFPTPTINRNERAKRVL